MSFTYFKQLFVPFINNSSVHYVFLSMSKKPAIYRESFYSKKGRSQILIFFKNLMWIEAEGNYTTLHIFHHKSRVARLSLSGLQELLVAENFFAGA